MAEHTSEPWSKDLENANNYAIHAESMHWKHIGMVYANHQGRAAVTAEETEANARRIVACINALAGSSTDDLERIIARFPTDPAARLRYLADMLSSTAKEIG